MCILEDSNYLHCVCLPILMLLYLMLYIMLAYLMLFTALFSAVCLCNAYFLLSTFANAFCFYALSLVIET